MDVSRVDQAQNEHGYDSEGWPMGYDSAYQTWHHQENQGEPTGGNMDQFGKGGKGSGEKGKKAKCKYKASQ